MDGVPGTLEQRGLGAVGEEGERSGVLVREPQPAALPSTCPPPPGSRREPPGDGLLDPLRPRGRPAEVTVRGGPAAEALLEDR